MKFSRMAGMISAALFSGTASYAQETGLQDIGSIRQAVTGFAGISPAEAGPIDSRLRLARCRTPLALSWHGTRGDTVAVSCPDAGGWRLFVPVKGAQVAQAPGAPVIARGDAVTIRFPGRGFSVTGTGKALGSGRVGQQISVRPDSGKAPIRARVNAAGLVTAQLER